LSYVHCDGIEGHNLKTNENADSKMTWRCQCLQRKHYVNVLIKIRKNLSIPKLI